MTKHIPDKSDADIIDSIYRKHNISGVAKERLTPQELVTLYMVSRFLKSDAYDPGYYRKKVEHDIGRNSCNRT